MSFYLPPCANQSFWAPHVSLVHPGHLSLICALVGAAPPSSIAFKWLEKSFDVVGGESDWDEDDLLISESFKTMERFVSLHSHPCTRTNLRLPDEAVRIVITKSAVYARELSSRPETKFPLYLFITAATVAETSIM
jgi:hypothetical protein